MDNIKLTIILALNVPLIIVSLSIIINQTKTQAFALNAFDQGWHDGQSLTQSTFLGGGVFDDVCSLGSNGHDVTYCQGNKIGYRVGWTNAQLFH